MAIPALPAPEASPSPPAKTAGVGRVYRPTALLRFTVFLEDFSNEDGKNAQREDIPAPQRANRAWAALTESQLRRSRRRANREVDIDADADTLAAEQDLKRANTGRGTSPSTAPNTAPRTTNAVVLRSMPIDLALELNGFKIADKLQATIPLHDFPILPEIQRATLVELFMGTITAEDFADPFNPTLSLPTESQTHLMFRGYVDEFDVEGNEDDFLVRVQATSLEARLMVAKINPFTRARRVKDGQLLSDFIKQLLSTIPEFSGALGDAIGVRFFPNVKASEEPRMDRKLFLMTLQSAASRAQGGGGMVQGDSTAANPAADPGTGVANMPPPAVGASQYSVWDVITRACEMCGLIPLYDPSLDPNSILLVPPQNIMETPEDGVKIPGGPIDGFSRDFQSIGSDRIRSEVRVMVWGHNIRSMKQTRKFGRIKAPAVRVVSYNPDAPGKQKVLVARYPKTVRGVAPSAVGAIRRPGGPGHPPIEEMVTRVIRGIRDQKTLENAAVALYHAISRQELTCRIETDDMASFMDPAVQNNHNADPDLLRLRAGTPVRVAVAKQQLDPSKGLVVNELSELFERRSNPAFLRRQLASQRARTSGVSDDDRKVLDDALAQVEKAMSTARLTDWFYVRTVNHRFSIDDGYSCEMELINFVEARNLTNLSADDKAVGNRMKEVKPGRHDQETPAQMAARLNRDALSETLRSTKR